MVPAVPLRGAPRGGGAWFDSTDGTNPEPWANETENIMTFTLHRTVGSSHAAYNTLTDEMLDTAMEVTNHGSTPDMDWLGEVFDYVYDENEIDEWTLEDDTHPDHNTVYDYYSDEEGEVQLVFNFRDRSITVHQKWELAGVYGPIGKALMEGDDEYRDAQAGFHVTAGGTTIIFSSESANDDNQEHDLLALTPYGTVVELSPLVDHNAVADYETLMELI